MLQKARGKQTETRETSSLIEVKRTLEEAREILRGLEGTALAGVAAQLSTAAESLAETAAVLHKIRPGLWVDREGIRPPSAPLLPLPPRGCTLVCHAIPLSASSGSMWGLLCGKHYRRG